MGVLSFPRKWRYLSQSIKSESYVPFTLPLIFGALAKGTSLSEELIVLGKKSVGEVSLTPCRSVADGR